MKNLSISGVYAVGLVIGFALFGTAIGIIAGKEIYDRPALQLKVIGEPGSATMIIYTYYTDGSGMEIKQGPYYEYGFGGRSKINILYNHGVAVRGGTMKFN